MARHPSIVSSKIWRTVVVAGAMLGAPACGGPKKPAPKDPAPAPTPSPTPAPTPDPDAEAKAKADADAKAADEAKLLADKAEADKKAKEEADKKAADEEAAKKKRPRGGGERPTGRGFILS
jgi:hypothetical protein